MPTNPLTWLMRRPQTQRRDLPRWLEGDDPKPPEGVIYVSGLIYRLSSFRPNASQPFVDRFAFLEAITDCFTKAPSVAVFCEHPWLIEDFKAILGLSWAEMAEIVGSEETTLIHISRGRKRVSQRTMERYLRNIWREFQRQKLVGRYEVVKKLYDAANLDRTVTAQEVTEASVAKAAEEVIQLTDCFTKPIPDWLLLTDPIAFLVIRLALGLTQRDMAKLLGVKQSVISKLEHGEAWFGLKLRYRSHRRIVAEKLWKAACDRGIARKVSVDDILRRFKRLRAISKGSFAFEGMAKIYGRKAAYAKEKREVRNSFEKEIIDLLETNGIRCYLHPPKKVSKYSAEVHAPIHYASGRTWYVDFALPAGNPKILVECRQTTRVDESNLINLVGPLVFKANMIKAMLPRAMIVLVLGVDLDIEELPIYSAIRYQPIDQVFTRRNLHKLPKFLKAILDG